MMQLNQSIDSTTSTSSPSRSQQNRASSSFENSFHPRQGPRPNAAASQARATLHRLCSVSCHRLAYSSICARIKCVLRPMKSLQRRSNSDAFQRLNPKQKKPRSPATRQSELSSSVIGRRWARNRAMASGRVQTRGAPSRSWVPGVTSPPSAAASTSEPESESSRLHIRRQRPESGYGPGASRGLAGSGFARLLSKSKAAARSCPSRVLERKGRELAAPAVSAAPPRQPGPLGAYGAVPFGGRPRFRSHLDSLDRRLDPARTPMSSRPSFLLRWTAM